MEIDIVGYTFNSNYKTGQKGGSVCVEFEGGFYKPIYYNYTTSIIDHRRITWAFFYQDQWFRLNNKPVSDQLYEAIASYTLPKESLCAN